MGSIKICLLQESSPKIMTAIHESTCMLRSKAVYCQCSNLALILALEETFDNKHP